MSVLHSGERETVASTEASSPMYDVVQGTAWITVQQAIVYLASFIFYVILARVLSKAEVGAVSLLSALLATFNAATLIALPQAATRYISRHLGIGESELAGSVAKTTLQLAIIISVPIAIAAAVLSPSVNHVFFPQGEDYVFPLMLTFAVGVVLDLYLLYGAYFLGAGMYAEYAYQTIFYVPFSRGLGLVLALTGLRVLGIVIGWLVGAVAAFALSWYMWRNHLPYKAPYPFRPILTFTIPLFASTLLSLWQQWGDIALLQARLGQLTTTGGYYLAVSSVGILSAFWFPLAAALFPALSAAHAKKDVEGVTSRLAIAFRLSNLSVFPVGLAMAALAPTLLTVAYGPSYATEALPFALLSTGTILTAQAAIYNSTLQAVGRTKTLFLITTSAIAVDLAWVWFLGPLLSSVAAALGRVIMSAIIVYLSYRTLGHTIPTGPFRGFRKALILGLGVSLPILVLDNLFMLLPLRPLERGPILVGVLVVVGVSVSRFFRIFHTGDFALLKEIVPRRYQSFLKRVERLIIAGDDHADIDSPV